MVHYFNRVFRLQNPNQSTKLECGAHYGAKLLLDVKKTSTLFRMFTGVNIVNMNILEQNLAKCSQCEHSEQKLSFFTSNNNFSPTLQLGSLIGVLKLEIPI